MEVREPGKTAGCDSEAAGVADKESPRPMLRDSHYLIQSLPFLGGERYDS